MNEEFLIIDAHVHTYPSAEVGRQALGSYGYGYSGTISEIREVMEKAKISHAVMANLTPIREMKEANLTKLSTGLGSGEKTKAIAEIDRKLIERMERRNRWTCERAREGSQLSALISVDILQSSEEMVRELHEKVVTLGAKGLKLHPMGNEYYPWDKRMWPVYSKARELNVPVLFHAGTTDLPGYNVQYARPIQFEKVARAFPELIIVLAHLGRGFYEESVEIARRCPNIFFDTSTCFSDSGCSSPKIAKEVFSIIKKIGAQRVMFGTDWPWYDPFQDIAIIKKMDLSYEEKAGILGLNAKAIYKI